jgi:hypothetical protein
MTEQAQGQPTSETTETQESRAGFTQEDVNKIAGTRAKEAKQAAINEVLQRAGVESLDDVFSYVEEYRALEEATASEADKANERYEKAEAKRKAAEERYTNTLRTFAFRDALRDSGINPERIPGALRLADLDALEVDEGGGVSGLEDAVAAVREASPEWFADAQPERPARRSPQATRQSAPSATDPETQHANFLASLLNGPYRSD